MKSARSRFQIAKTPVAIAIGALVTLVAFQNCSKPSDILKTSQSSYSRKLGFEDYATFTNKIDVNVSLDISYAREMYLTSDPSCQSGGDWEPYATTRAWSLKGSDGYFTIYGKFRTIGGEEVPCLSGGIVRDTQAPVAVLSIAPILESTTKSAVFEYSASDVLSGIKELRCQVDALPVELCPTKPSKLSLSNLSEGLHSLKLVAVDYAGNLSTVVQHIWRVDTVAPISRFTVTAPASTQQTFATFEFDATDADGRAGVVFECKLDLNAPTACNSPYTYSGLGVGAHSLQLIAIDLAGNRSAPRTFGWTIQP